MSMEEKEALLNDISKLSEKDKAFVIGYCAGRVADDEEEQKAGRVADDEKEQK